MRHYCKNRAKASAGCGVKAKELWILRESAPGVLRDKMDTINEYSFATDCR